MGLTLDAHSVDRVYRVIDGHGSIVRLDGDRVRQSQFSVTMRGMAPEQFGDRETTTDRIWDGAFGSRSLHRHFVSVDNSDHLDVGSVETLPGSALSMFR